MKPIDALQPVAPGWTGTTYARDQPEYQPLPVVRNGNGDVVSAWALTWRERLRVLFTGRLYFGLLTFNKPLQPILPMSQPPVLLADGSWHEADKPIETFVCECCEKQFALENRRTTDDDVPLCPPCFDAVQLTHVTEGVN